MGHIGKENEKKEKTEHKLPFGLANLPLSSRSGSSFDNDGGARRCDRTRLCNLSPSRRLHSRKQLLLYATKKREDQTSEAVKTHRNGALNHIGCNLHSQRKIFRLSDKHSEYASRCTELYIRNHEFNEDSTNTNKLHYKR